MSKRTIEGKGLLLILSILLVVCMLSVAPASGAESVSQLMAKYYEGAKKEAKLVIYGLGPPFLGPIRDAFNKRYPGIVMEAFDESGRETTERIIAEQKTGRVVGDLVIAGGGTHIG